jgi:hypothetical protein
MYVYIFTKEIKMAIVKTGEKLVKRTFYSELKDWEKISQIAKEKNQTTGQYIRVLLSRIVNYEEEKIRAKHELGPKGEA